MILSTADTVKVLQEIQQICRNAEDCVECEFFGKKSQFCVFSCGADDWKLTEVENA